MRQQRNATAELSHRQDDEGVGQQRVIGVDADRRGVDGAGADPGNGGNRRGPLSPLVDVLCNQVRRFRDLADVNISYSTIALLPMC
jgi:hypothetical protein